MRKKYIYFCMSFICILSFSACTNSPVQTNDSKASVQTVTASKPPTRNLNLGLLSNLIGNWKIQDWQLQKNGEWQEQAGATWSFFAIQGGTAIRDEWKSNTSDSQTTPGFGSQLRVYNPWSKSWSAVWLSSRTRSLEYYTGNETETEVSFISQVNEKGRITKVIFSDIQETSFSWQMQWSSNSGESWTSVYKLQATRISE